MPQAFTLGRTSRYVQITLTDRYAPRREPMHTTEIKGKKRYGEGLLYRIVGRLAVGVGRWKEPPSVAKIEEMAEAEGTITWPRLINDEEAVEIRARLTDVNYRKMQDGWAPPVWHWRRYQEFVLPWLHRLRLVDVEAYGDVHFRRPTWWPLTPTTDGWVPMTVAEDMPTVQVDDVGSVGA